MIEDDDDFFVYGSYEGLMMSYGGLQSGDFKMMPIREFMMHFDEG